MLPDKEVINGDVGNLWLGSIWSEESEPVLSGDDVVWVDAALGQFQSIQELLELFGGQGVDILPHNGSFPLVTVWSYPAKLALAAIITCKVTCNIKSKLIVKLCTNM